MGLFDKLKNIFIEDELDEDDIVKDIPKKEVKEETKEDINKDIEPVKEVKKSIPISDDTFSDRELLDTNQKFKFPIIFEDEDFKEEKTKSKSINVLEKANTKYEPENRKEFKTVKKAFKPSPVISPVYGVLDKNYYKDDDAKDGLRIDIEEKIDIDYVMKKAHGDKKETREDKHKIEANDELIDTIEENKGQEQVIVTAEEIDEKIKSIDELLKNTTDDDFYSLVDKMYEDEEEREE